MLIEARTFLHLFADGAASVSIMMLVLFVMATGAANALCLGATGGSNIPCRSTSIRRLNQQMREQVNLHSLKRHHQKAISIQNPSPLQRRIDAYYLFFSIYSLVVAILFYGSVIVTDMKDRDYSFVHAICNIMSAGDYFFSSASIKKMMASVGIMGFPLDLLRNRHSTLALSSADRFAWNLGMLFKNAGAILTQAIHSGIFHTFWAAAYFHGELSQLYVISKFHKSWFWIFYLSAIAVAVAAMGIFYLSDRVVGARTRSRSYWQLEWVSVLLLLLRPAMEVTLCSLQLFCSLS